MLRKTKLVLTALAIVCFAAGCGDSGQEGELDALLQGGWRAYSTGDFDVAIASFRAVADAPGSTPEQSYSALLGLATTYHLQTSPDLGKAKDYYAKLAKLDSADARRQSLLGLAQIDLAEGRAADGQAKLTTLIKEFPESADADEATIHLAASLLAPMPDANAPGGFVPRREALAERGVRVLKERLQAYPHNGLAAGMHIMLAAHYTSRRDMRAAVDHLLAAEREGIAVVKTRSSVLWQIARIAEKELKDYDLAERYYGLYADEFSRTALYYRALKSLERVRALKAEQGA